MIATDLKTGAVYKENARPLLVLKYSHIKTSRGSANVRVRVRDLIDGHVLEKSYISGDKVEAADVYRKNAQYLYHDASGYVFMDPETYVQFQIPEDLLEEQQSYLLEGEEVSVLYFEGNPVSVDLPNNMVFEVEYTEPGFRGNTVTNVLKDATMTTGLVVKVPPFIKIGDTIRVDTRTGEYVSKA